MQEAYIHPSAKWIHASARAKEGRFAVKSKPHMKTYTVKVEVKVSALKGGACGKHLGQIIPVYGMNIERLSWIRVVRPHIH